MGEVAFSNARVVLGDEVIEGSVQDRKSVV